MNRITPSQPLAQVDHDLKKKNKKRGDGKDFWWGNSLSANDSRPPYLQKWHRLITIGVSLLI